MFRSGVTKNGGVSQQRGIDLVAPGLAIVGLVLSFCLQFVRYAEPLIGRSDSAISGATILSVSLVFTGAMFLASHHYRRRVEDFRAAAAEAADVSDLIARGRRTASLIRAHRVAPGRLGD